MQLILVEDIPTLGRAGELVTVKPGYGRNYLLPRKLAVLASAQNVKNLEHQKAVITAREEKRKGEAQSLAKKIEAVKVRIARKVGEQDKLYGSVTTLDIADALSAAGQPVDRRQIHMPEPIKTLGTHEVELRLHRDVVAKIKVEVAAEA